MHGPPGWLWFALILGLGCVALVAVIFFATLFRPWYRAAAHGTHVPLPAVVRMRLRGYPVSLLIDALIELQHAGVAVTITELARTYSQHKTSLSSSSHLVNFVKDERETGSC